MHLFIHSASHCRRAQNADELDVEQYETASSQPALAVMHLFSHVTAPPSLVQLTQAVRLWMG